MRKQQRQKSKTKEMQSQKIASNRSQQKINPPKGPLLPKNPKLLSWQKRKKLRDLLLLKSKKLQKLSQLKRKSRSKNNSSRLSSLLKQQNL